MSDESTERPPAGNGAGEVQRTWNSRRRGQRARRRSRDQRRPWNPGGVGNATEDEIVDQDDPEASDTAEAAGE